MMALPVRPATWLALGLVVGTLGTSTWLHAQSGDPRREPAGQAFREAVPGQGGKVYTGADMGFRVVGVRGDTPVVVPVVKVNGEWVDVDLGGGGIRKLTK